ncbi:hypothetical protein ACODT5_03405 [Streptomyces sp. 5.8]|uniref:hypothetical protein n=1 Tax=Streptomyces sp. 5.8 TaxID=3406571 RepID=UPI003BB6F613
MQLLDLFRRRQQDIGTDFPDIDPMPTDHVLGDFEPEPEPDVPLPLIRFLTMGGAVVAVTAYRFTTTVTWKGRPYVDRENPRKVDGFRWECGGCSATGATDGSSGPRMDFGSYLPDEWDLARTDANDHANKCRAMDPAALD